MFVCFSIKMRISTLVSIMLSGIADSEVRSYSLMQRLLKKSGMHTDIYEC